MRIFKQTPLAWLQIKKEKGRFLVAIAGVVFADVLMFFQLGQLDALFDGATLVLRKMQGEIVIINAATRTVTNLEPFPRERLFQALSYEPVKSVNILYSSNVIWTNPETRQRRGIAVWGVDPANPSLQVDGLAAESDRLKLLSNILFDQTSRPEFGAIPALLQQRSDVEVQVNGQMMRTVGLFSLGASFSADGNIIASDSTFLKLVRNRAADRIDVGLITLQPGADIQAMVQALRRDLPPDVRVLSLSDWVAEERAYWETQGLGIIFLTGVVIGFGVGIIIVYQILHSNVVDHLPEYATLKAMGYSNNFLLTMLLQQVFLLAILGFIPGFFASIGIYHLTYILTLTPVAMKAERAVLVLFLTVLMCSASGFIAIQKLRSADPADIF
jgi:putative ABC transport system permease protein